MRPTQLQIPLAPHPDGRESRRREPRESVVRRVEYCRFPRVCADQRIRLAVTRDLSPSGLCLRSEVAEPVGALLRVSVRGLDGHAERDGIARVAWSQPAGDGSHWLGLSLLAAKPGQPIRLRYVRRAPHGRVAEVA